MCEFTNNRANNKGIIQVFIVGIMYAFLIVYSIPRNDPKG